MFPKQQDLLGCKIKGYYILRVLGSGSFSKVYEAYYETNKTTVAIKAIPKSLLTNKKYKQLAQSEIRIMKACANNPNIIKFIDNFVTLQTLLIVMEYCEGGELQKYLQKKGRLSQDQATYYLKQIINGFKGLHQKNIIHRDLKSANILLKGGVAKIADLGCAKMLTQGNGIAYTELGTPLTMAPQVQEGNGYDLKADIWSLGVVYYQLIYGRYPYNEKSGYLIYQASKKPPNLSGVHLTQNARNFILRCLTFNPKQRMSWVQLYSHELIREEEKARYGVEINKINFAQNKKIYELPAQIKKLNPSTRDNISSFPQEKGVHLQSVDLNKIKEQNEQKKKKQSSVQQYTHKYLNRRNNFLFVFKYIIPCINSIGKVPLNHAHYLIILAKDAYLKLFEMANLMKSKVNFMKLQPYFEDFINSPQYLQLINMIETDSMLAKVQFQQYPSFIKNPSKQMKEDLNIESKWRPNYQKEIRQVAQQYEYQLIDYIDNVKKENKNKLIMVIEALAYFINLQNDSQFEIFEKAHEHLNFSDAEMNIRARLEYHLNSFK